MNSSAPGRDGTPRRLSGHVAAVTGGGSGIGAAIATRLAEDGAAVAVLDLSIDAAQEVTSTLEHGLALSADVSDSAAVEAALDSVEDELGALTIMINNAGALAMDHVQRVTERLRAQRAEQEAGAGVSTPLDALVRLTDEEWRFVMSVHLDGTFYGTRAAIRRMAPRGTGSVVNMASVCGLEGCTGHPHYSAAKAGILGLTRATAKEVISQGIRVNAIAPGFIDTARNRTSLDTVRQVNVERVPAGRYGTPEEIAAAVAFLASDEASYFVGATLNANGGLVTAV